MNKPEEINAFAKDFLPGHLQMKFVEIEGTRLLAKIDVQKFHMAPNGFLHAGTVVAFADSVSGIACVTNLPEGASGFTTIELKSNFLGTAREGTIWTESKAVHLGRNTQVWDAKVWRESDEKTIAEFRCTQMILYPKK